MKKITLTIAFLSLFCYIVKAQIGTGEPPTSWQNTMGRALAPSIPAGADL